MCDDSDWFKNFFLAKKDGYSKNFSFKICILKNDPKIIDLQFVYQEIMIHAE
jgi:hypothetical protein